MTMFPPTPRDSDSLLGYTGFGFFFVIRSFLLDVRQTEDNIVKYNSTINKLETGHDLKVETLGIDSVSLFPRLM